MAIERDEPVAFFDKSVDNVLSTHYRLEPQLREALLQGQFVNYYQPKINLATGAIVGVEALIRWIHPQRGLVPPMEFVPALESTGLINEVGNHIIQRALADWCRWRDAGLPAPRIAVNVAAGQLRSEDFVKELRAALQANGGDATALGVEVTESILISNMERAIEVLTQVRKLGIPVAIDDFGTGYSSLAYIVNTCISLAHNLNLKVVAEGVEIEGQAAMLKQLGCDQAQGFLYSPPVPADQLARMLRESA